MQNLQSSNSSRFTEACRLLRVDGFDHVIRKEKVADKHFKVFFTHNSKNNARLGIIANKKLIPYSVDRNRVKRLIRETFRQHNIKHSKLDLVVMLCGNYSRKIEMRIDNLNKLFSQVEGRCAKS